MPHFFYVRDDETKRLQVIEKLQDNPRSPELWLEVLKSIPPHVKTYGRIRIFRRAIALMDVVDQYRDVPSYVQIRILYAKLQG